MTLPHGAHVVELTTRADTRGSFTETFRQEWLPADVPGMVQTNLSISRTGVLRGMHVHHRQADYWCVIEGSAFVALHDLRADSPTYRTTWSETFNASTGLRGLYVPPGVAHGFCALTDLRMLYLVDSYFTGDDEYGFAWDDADAAIGWPIADPIVSERDARAPAMTVVLGGLPRSEE